VQSVRSSSLFLKIARSPENVGKRALVLTEKGQRCLIRRSFAGNHTSRALLPLYSPRGLELSRLKSIADRPEAVAPVEPVISHLVRLPPLAFALATRFLTVPNVLYGQQNLRTVARREQLPALPLRSASSRKSQLGDNNLEI